MIGPLLSRRQLIRGAPAILLGLRAAPALGAVSDLNFLVVGDWGRHGGDYQVHVARQMARVAVRTTSEFVVSTGDNFYELGVSSERDPQWDSSFERIYKDEALQVPWYAVLGNHDYGGDVDAQVHRTQLSPRWRMCGRWHDSTHRVGDIRVQLLFLDTITWLGHESFPFTIFGSSVRPGDQQRQRDWLVARLAEPADVRIVFGHYPIFSVGPHGGHQKMVDLDSVLRAGGVTAYVCGHDHCLYYAEYKGMHYVCSGGGSQELGKFTGDPKTWGCVLPGDCADNRPGWRDYVGRAGFAAFSISSAGLVRFRFIDRDGFQSPLRVLLRGAPSIEEGELAPVFGRRMLST